MVKHRNCSVQTLSSAQLFATPWTTQHTRPPCPSPTSGVHPNPSPLSQWCHSTISSSVIPFSSCPQSFLTSGSFPISQPFSSGGQRIEAAISASVLPVTNQSWFPFGLTGLILQSKELSRVLFSTSVWKHQVFDAQPPLWSNSHIFTWFLEKP